MLDKTSKDSAAIVENVLVHQCGVKTPITLETLHEARVCTNRSTHGHQTFSSRNSTIATLVLNLRRVPNISGVGTHSTAEKTDSSNCMSCVSLSCRRPNGTTAMKGVLRSSSVLGYHLNAMS